jgi:hypothetical protein
VSNILYKQGLYILKILIQNNYKTIFSLTISKKIIIINMNKKYFYPFIPSRSRYHSNSLRTPSSVSVRWCQPRLWSLLTSMSYLLFFHINDFRHREKSRSPSPGVNYIIELSFLLRFPVVSEKYHLRK